MSFSTGRLILGLYHRAPEMPDHPGRFRAIFVTGPGKRLALTGCKPLKLAPACHSLMNIGSTGLSYAESDEDDAKFYARPFEF